MNLITLVAHLTIGSAFAAGVPALTSDHPRPDLLAIVSFFGGPKCTGDSMVISSGTWSNLDAGCSPLNATWSMQSAQLGLLGNGCRGEFAYYELSLATVVVGAKFGKRISVSLSR